MHSFAIIVDHACDKHTAEYSIEIGYRSPAVDVDIQTIVKNRVIVRNQQVCRLDREAPWPVNAIKAVELRAERIFASASVQLSDDAKGTMQPLLDCRIKRRFLG